MDNQNQRPRIRNAFFEHHMGEQARLLAQFESSVADNVDRAVAGIGSDRELVTALQAGILAKYYLRKIARK